MSDIRKFLSLSVRLVWLLQRYYRTLPSSWSSILMHLPIAQPCWYGIKNLCDKAEAFETVKDFRVWEILARFLTWSIGSGTTSHFLIKLPAPDDRLKLLRNQHSFIPRTPLWGKVSVTTEGKLNKWEEVVIIWVLICKYRCKAHETDKVNWMFSNSWPPSPHFLLLNQIITIHSFTSGLEWY